MFHISGKRAMSAPNDAAWRQARSPCSRFAAWSKPEGVSWSSAILNSISDSLVGTGSRAPLLDCADEGDHKGPDDIATELAIDEGSQLDEELLAVARIHLSRIRIRPDEID